MTNSGPEEPIQRTYSDEELKELLAEDKQAKRYELPSFALVVGKYNRKLYFYALIIVKHEQDAEDVTQETFINAYKDMVINYSSERILAMNLAGYLYKITRNEALQVLAKRKSPVHYGTTSIDALTYEELDSLFHSISIRVISFTQEVEVREMFNAAFKTLTENEQKAVILHFIADMKYKDIAKELTMMESGVKILIFRARIKLRDYFTGQDDKKESNP